jgi:hypothetical protein
VGSGPHHELRTLLEKLMVEETKTIELWPCRYDARCNVRHCKAKATTLARSVDSGGQR